MILELTALGLCCSATGVSVYYLIKNDIINEKCVQDCLIILENKLNKFGDKAYDKIVEWDKKLDKFIEENLEKNNSIKDDVDEIEILIHSHKNNEEEEEINIESEIQQDDIIYEETETESSLTPTEEFIVLYGDD